MSPHPWFGSFVSVVALAMIAGWSDSALAQPRRVKAKGEVVTVVGNQVTMLDSQKGLLLVRPKAESPLIEISGPWPLSEIKPGLVIRLTGTVKNNALVEEVAELILHSPADGFQFGIQQDAAEQPATIVGQFVRIKDRQLVVSLGKRRITAKLAEEAVARVESKDLRFAKKGDQIEIDAYTTSSGTLSGRSIKVTVQPPKSEGDDKSPQSEKKAPAGRQ